MRNIENEIENNSDIESDVEDLENQDPIENDPHDREVDPASSDEDAVEALNFMRNTWKQISPPIQEKDVKGRWYAAINRTVGTKSKDF